jgi:nucleotide-binding universal stress UspA family protein
MRAILLPLDGSKADRWAIETGMTVAASVGAHVTVLLPRLEMAEVPLYAHYATASGFAVLVQNVRDQADAKYEDAKRLIEEVGALRGIPLSTRPDDAGPTASLESPSGDPEILIRRWAAVHDLVLYPRRSRESDEALPAPLGLKSLLEYSGRPVLIATDEVPTRFAKVAIAWNGSAEGAQAVTAALPFLRLADRIVVLTVATSKTGAAEGERLRNYLLRHGLDAEIAARTALGSVGDALMRAATEHGADLLVTGCYTHSRVRQSLFGGVTHHLLENCRLPMLMAH